MKNTQAVAKEISVKEALPQDTVPAKIGRFYQSLQHNPSERAELARCASVADARCLPAYYRLLDAFGGASSEPQKERIAIAAILLSLIRKDGDSRQTLARLARNSVTDMRFSAILRSRSNEELLNSLRSVLPILKYKCNPLQLALDLYYWGENTRIRWAEDYYGVNPQTEEEEPE